MKKYILKKAENKYKKLQKFYSQFEMNIPSLEYTLYKKYPKNRWLTFIIINAINIGFFIFWLASLYYMSSVSNYCYTQLNIYNQYFNITGLNITDINITDMIK